MRVEAIARLLGACSLLLLSIYPPQLALRESWLGPTCLVLAALLASPSQRRLNTAFLFLGALTLSATLAAGNIDALGSIRWLLIYVLAFRLGQDQYSNSGSMRALSLVFCAALAIQAGIALTQFPPPQALPAGLGPAAGILSDGRIWGAFSTPNVFAAWLLLALPLLFFSSIQADTMRQKMGFGLAALAALFMLALTRSVGAWLALGMAFSILAFFAVPNRRWLIAAAAAAGFALLGTLAWRGFTFNGMSLRRWVLWKPAFSAWLESPWFGHGPSGALTAYRQACERMELGFGEHPHQWVLSFLLSYGAFGVLCAALALGLAWALIRRRLAQNAGTTGILGLEVSVLAGLLHAQWEMSFQHPSILLPWMLLLGALCGGGSAVEAPRPLQVPIGRRTLWFGSAILVLLAWRAGLMAWQWPLLVLLLAVLAWQRPAPTLGRPGLAFLGLILFTGLGFWWSLNPAATADLFFAAMLLWTAAQNLRFEKSEAPLILFTFIAALFSLASLFVPLDSIHAFFPNQNLLSGAVFVPALLLGAAAIFEGKMSPGWAALVLLTAAGIAVSGSRGAMLALCGGALWLFYRFARFSPRRVALAGLGLGIFCAGVFLHPASVLSQRLARQQAPAGADAHFNFRWEIWKASLAASSERWAQGWGLGSYERVMESRELKVPQGEQRLTLEHAHSSWVEFALEAGWLAALGALSFLLFLFWRWRRDPPDLGRAALEAAFAALIVHAAVDFEISTPYCLFLGALLLALREKAPSGGFLSAASWRWSVALAGAFLISGSSALWLEKKLKLLPLSCDASPYRSLSSMRPYDVTLIARQAMQDARCFDEGRDSRGLSRALRALSVGLDADPADKKARQLFSALLRHAAKVLTQENLTALGHLIPGWFELSRTSPGLNPSEKFSLISVIQGKMAGSAQ